LPESIFIIQKLIENDNCDIASIYKQEDNNISKRLLTSEEKRKFELYLTFGDDREELENKFWNAEDHPIWAAEINSLIDWATDNGEFKIDEFDKYNDTFNRLFGGNKEEVKKKEPEFDLTRRALLTRELKEYPCIFKGNTNYSFCSKPSHWKDLIRKHPDEIKKFLDILINEKNEKNIDYEDTEKRMIEKYDKKENDLYYFIHNEELLKYCRKKIIQRNGDDWILIQNERKSSNYISFKTFLLYIELETTEHSFFSDWKLGIYDCSNAAAYLKKGSISIEVRYTKNDSYQLQLFKNDGSSNIDIVNIAKKENLEQKERYESKEMNKDEILFLLKRLVSYC